MNGYMSATQNFPDFAGYPRFMSRPVYPALGALMPRLVQLVVALPNPRHAFTEPAPTRLVFLSLEFLNFLLYVVAVQIFYRWLRLHWSETLSLIAALLFALSQIWLRNVASPGTRPWGFFAIIVCVYLFDRYLLRDNRPTWKTIVWVGLIAGILMLGKTEYEGLLAVWLWAAYERKWKVLSATFLIHFVPLIVWIGVLKLSGITFYQVDVDGFGHGTWLFETIGSGRWLQIYTVAADLTGLFFASYLSNFTAPLLALAAWSLLFEREHIDDHWRMRFVLAVVAAIALAVGIGDQEFASRFPFSTFYVVYPLAVMALIRLVTWLAESLSGRLRWSQAALIPTLIVAALMLHTLFEWHYLSMFSAITGSGAPDGMVFKPTFTYYGEALRRFENLLARTGPGQP
jgi:hypothetical protein